MSYNGFSVLAWVKRDSTLIANCSEESAERISRQLLRDFICLLSVRWNMDLTLCEHEGTKYAYGVNTRITASERTIKNAIGDLSNHVDFLKGTASTSSEDLANYRQCREKWKVPDEVTSTYSYYGSEDSAVPGTSQLIKRKRFS